MISAMRLIRSIICLSLLCAVSGGAFSAKAVSAEQALSGFVRNMQQFSQSYRQEKVYIQFDNSSYYSGETIWFKAFVTDASTHRRTESKVLYVDLISPTGVLLKRQKLKIVAGQADGSFPLIDGSTDYARELRGTVLPYPSGFYEVRAYTMNMLNFGDEIVFSRVLPVFERPDENGNFYDGPPLILNHYNQEIETTSARPKSPSAGGKLNASFYPEGGTLLQGVPCRVAFQLTGSDGMPVAATGMLGDSLPLAVTHDGMGVFTFVPDGGRATAVFEYDGHSSSFQLPAPAARGCSVCADVRRDHIAVSIYERGLVDTDTLGLLLACRGVAYYFECVPVTAGHNSLSVPLDGVPEGVCELTLFDSTGAVYASRLLYHRSSTVSPSLTMDESDEPLEPFAPVKLKFELNDAAGAALRDRFCLSVRDSRCPGTAVYDDLRTSLLLSSDIRGYVHNPDYYFESDDTARLKALDILMMVNGWRRYDWETMAGIKPYTEVHRMEKSLTLNGWVESPLTRKPMDSIVVTAAVTSWDKKNIERFRYVTGPDGYFGFDLQDFQDNARLTISANPRRRRLVGTSARIRLERSMLPTVRAFLPQETLLMDASGQKNTQKKRGVVTMEPEEEAFPTVVDVNDGILLPDVDIKEKRKYVDYYTFKAYDVHQDTQMELDLGDFSTDVPGYLISKGYSVEQSESGLLINGHKTFFYIHEPERYIRFHGKIDTEDIKSLMVFDRVINMREAYDLSPLLMEWKYKHGEYLTPEDMENAERQRVVFVEIVLKEEHQRPTRAEIMHINSRVATVDGFSAPYEFYSPQYPEGPVRGEVDYRRTIYWNPNVITDNNGRAEVEFYNNSYSSHFTVTGAGITASGTPYVLKSDY